MNLTNQRRPFRATMSCVRKLAVGVVMLGLTGCGSAIHLTKERGAQRNFEEARELGAEQYAPYEYYSAKVRIEEAKRQAAYAEYGTAARLSDEAKEYSQKAIAIAKKARRQGSALQEKETGE